VSTRIDLRLLRGCAQTLFDVSATRRTRAAKTRLTHTSGTGAALMPCQIVPWIRLVLPFFDRVLHSWSAGCSVPSGGACSIGEPRSGFRLRLFAFPVASPRLAGARQSGGGRRGAG
jgi:hypothetical protein